jgi:hypothetical protein
MSKVAMSWVISTQLMPAWSASQLVVARYSRRVSVAEFGRSLIHPGRVRENDSGTMGAHAAPLLPAGSRHSYRTSDHSDYVRDFLRGTRSH